MENISLHGFKKAAEEAFKGGKPLDSKEFGQRIAESITEELNEFGNLSKDDAAEIGLVIEEELKDVISKSDNQINSENIDAFNKIRGDVSVIVGKKVIPKIFEKFNVDISLKDKIGVGNLMRLAVQCLQTELFEGEVDTAQWSVVSKMEAAEMRNELISNGVITEKEYLSEDFGKMSKGEEFENAEQITAASIMTMNAAWKTVQLGRGVAEMEKAKSMPEGTEEEKEKKTKAVKTAESRTTVGGNYGTFQEMVKAMYKIGIEKSGGNSKIGLIRAIFELAKDLKQVHNTKV